MTTRNNRWHLVICGTIALVLTVWSICYFQSKPGMLHSLIFHVSYKSPELVELSNLKQLSVALWNYAEDHDDRYPAQISELPSDTNLEWVIQFHDPVTKEASNWFYYPGRTRNDPPGTILLGSPVTVGKQKRIVAFADGSAVLMDEAEFQQRLAAQRKKDQASAKQP